MDSSQFYLRIDNEKRYSQHQVSNLEQLSFSPNDYSLFKYGNTSIAKRFGKELAKGFIHEFRDELLEQKQIVLLPSPFFSIPTASNFLTWFFKDELNLFLFRNNRSSVVESKIHRKHTYITDYGCLTFEERVKIIENDTYHIDKAMLENKYCIFVDDIRITGSHELIIKRLIKQYKIKGLFRFLYFAEKTNDELPANIENYFNYHAINSVEDIQSVILDPSFKFNTRVTKKILSLAKKDFEKVVRVMTPSQRSHMFRLSLSNNYHKISLYKENIYQLSQHG